MKVNILDDGDKVNFPHPATPCCESMSKALKDRENTLNNLPNSADNSIERYEYLDFLGYDNKDQTKPDYYPIKFCPFCGEAIDFEYVNISPNKSNLNA